MDGLPDKLEEGNKREGGEKDMKLKQMEIVILAVAILGCVVVTASAGVIPCSQTITLSERNCSNLGGGNWDFSVLPGGNYGELEYTLTEDGILTYNFVVVDGDTLSGPHSLFIIYPELGGSGEWPQTGSMKLAGLSGTVDISGLLGYVDDGVDYNGEVYGAKVWYYPTADFNDTTAEFDIWNCSQALFEEDLITYTPPCPTPVLTPFGLIALFGLLSAVVVVSLRMKKRP